jgi:hypothetical protein
MTRMAVATALVFPYSITLYAKDPKGVLIVLYFLHSGSTLIWRYQSARYMVKQYFALLRILRVSTLLGIGP